jgi:hypothetical protein
MRLAVQLQRDTGKQLGSQLHQAVLNLKSSTCNMQSNTRQYHVAKHVTLPKITIPPPLLYLALKVRYSFMTLMRLKQPYAALM